MPDPRVREAAVWGVLAGAIQAASPLAFWWLDTATVYALGLVLIAAVYIGFAVADGRPKVIVVESGVALSSCWSPRRRSPARPWLLVVGSSATG